MAGPLENPSTKAAKHEVADGKPSSHSDGHPDPKTEARNKPFDGVAQAAAAGAALGEAAGMLGKAGERAGEGIGKTAAKEGVHAREQSEARDLAKEKEKLGLPHLEVTHPLDKNTSKAVDAAADQMVKSHGKDHSLADAVMKHAFLTDPKHQNGDRYNEVYKALDAKVANLSHGAERVNAHVIEHGRVAASMVQSKDNYYGAQGAKSGGGDQKPLQYQIADHHKV